MGRRVRMVTRDWAAWGLTRLPAWTSSRPVRPAMGDRRVVQERLSRADSRAAWSTFTVAAEESALALAVSKVPLSM